MIYPSANKYYCPFCKAEGDAARDELAPICVRCNWPMLPKKQVTPLK